MNKKNKKKQALSGIEPWIFCVRGKRLDRWATRAYVLYESELAYYK